LFICKKQIQLYMALMIADTLMKQSFSFGLCQ